MADMEDDFIGKKLVSSLDTAMASVCMQAHTHTHTLCSTMSVIGDTTRATRSTLLHGCLCIRPAAAAAAARLWLTRSSSSSSFGRCSQDGAIVWCECRVCLCSHQAPCIVYKSTIVTGHTAHCALRSTYRDITA